MSLEEKILWNSLIYSPIMIHPGLIKASGVPHSNLFISPQTTNKQTPEPIELTQELDSKCVQEQVQFKVLEPHSSPLVSRSVPQGCSLWVLGVAESWGNGVSKVIFP